jgi:hypothetical protein
MAIASSSPTTSGRAPLSESQHCEAFPRSTRSSTPAAGKSFVNSSLQDLWINTLQDYTTHNGGQPQSFDWSGHLTATGTSDVPSALHTDFASTFDLPIWDVPLANAGQSFPLDWFLTDTARNDIGDTDMTDDSSGKLGWPFSF